jgi:hypothetical protein
MSRRQSADPLERHYTPLAFARAAVRYLADQGIIHAVETNTVLEPSAGSGAWLRALHDEEVGGFYTAVDADPEAPALRPSSYITRGVCGRFETQSQAALQGASPARLGRAYDLIIGNPPFSWAENHARHGLQMLSPKGRLVFLVRQSFLATKERFPFFDQCPPAHVVMVSRRICFGKDKHGRYSVDNAEYALAVWEPERKPTSYVQSVQSFKPGGSRMHWMPPWEGENRPWAGEP